jgi:hypothetical protein
MLSTTLYGVPVVLVSSLCGLPVAPAGAGSPSGVVGDGTAASCTYAELLTESTHLTLSDAVMTADAGGARRNRGRLVLEDVVLEQASAQGYYGGGGVYNQAGTLLVRNSTLRYNSSGGGGAIYNDVGAHAVIEGSQLLSNTVPNSVYGGAISNAGVLTITTSTFMGNRLTLNTRCPTHCGGGAIANFDFAVISISRTTFIRNSTNMDSTLAGNTALTHGGGLLNELGTAALTQTTVAGNAGEGIANSTHLLSFLHLQSVLLVDKKPVNCHDQAPDTATFNLSTDATCFAAFNGNQVNAAQLLGPLAKNGGLTLTRMPAPNSPAINNGQCVVGLPLDQRGLARQVGPSCDVGAVERQAVDYGWYVSLPQVVR